MDKRLFIKVEGRVQGVGFRFFTQKTARRFHIWGWVMNAFDGSVEIEAQGETGNLELFLENIRKGPILSEVTNIKFKDIPVLQNQNSFQIRY